MDHDPKTCLWCLPKHHVKQGTVIRRGWYHNQGVAEWESWEVWRIGGMYIVIRRN